MKCPNVWCVMRTVEKGECMRFNVKPEHRLNVNFSDKCHIKLCYEKEFCPTEEEYFKISKTEMDEIQKEVEDIDPIF